MRRPKEPTRFDGVSLAAKLRGQAGESPDRKLVVQFSRMNAPAAEEGRRLRVVASVAAGGE